MELEQGNLGLNGAATRSDSDAQGVRSNQSGLSAALVTDAALVTGSPLLGAITAPAATIDGNMDGFGKSGFVSDGAAAWRAAVDHTRRCSPGSFDQWFASVQLDVLRVGSASDNELVLTARDEFVRDWVKTHFLPTLLSKLEAQLGLTSSDRIVVKWKVSSELHAPISQPPGLQPQKSGMPPGADSDLLNATAGERDVGGRAMSQELDRQIADGAPSTLPSDPRINTWSLARTQDFSAQGGSAPAAASPSDTVVTGSTVIHSVPQQPVLQQSVSQELSSQGHMSADNVVVSAPAAVSPALDPTAIAQAGGTTPTSRASSAAPLLVTSPFAVPASSVPASSVPASSVPASSVPASSVYRGNGMSANHVPTTGATASGTLAAGRSSPVTAPTRPRVLMTANGDPLNPKSTFSNFVVGPSNELAYAAAIASAGGNGRRYNPLFLCGGTGLGKTHLMHSIAHRVLELRPNACVIYVSAERFTNEFIESLQHHKMEEFRSRYRRHCDVLLLDDIQFLAGREQTQEEFFHTFNALHDADKPIVVSSDKYPQDLQRMPERLISRFTSGLVADVHVPALETRVAIVKKKAELEGLLLTDEVAVLLAQAVKSNVRELEGALIRLAAKSSLTGRSIDEEFARSEIATGLSHRSEVQSVEEIQRAVCHHFRLSNADLLSKDRHKSVAFARQVAMYLCRQRLKCSFPELGRAFGNRDHTTVMSAVRRVEALRQTDPQVNAHLEAITQKLASGD